MRRWLGVQVEFTDWEGEQIGVKIWECEFRGWVYDIRYREGLAGKDEGDEQSIDKSAYTLVLSEYDRS